MGIEAESRPFSQEYFKAPQEATVRKKSFVGSKPGFWNFGKGQRGNRRQYRACKLRPMRIRMLQAKKKHKQKGRQEDATRQTVENSRRQVFLPLPLLLLSSLLFLLFLLFLRTEPGNNNCFEAYYIFSPSLILVINCRTAASMMVFYEKHNKSVLKYRAAIIIFSNLLTVFKFSNRQRCF